MSGNGMVRPCSCPANKGSWQGAPTFAGEEPAPDLIRGARRADEGWRAIARRCRHMLTCHDVLHAAPTDPSRSFASQRRHTNLRARRLQKFKFVRQAPIGPYIVDFLCREARLIVEVDGATHSE